MSTTLAAAFVTLSEFLNDHRALYNFDSLAQEHPPWRERFPQWSAAISALNHSQRRRLIETAPSHHDREWLCLPEPYSELVQASLSFNAALSPRAEPSVGAAPRKVPAKKWRQIQAFHSQLKSPAACWIDWCGGKSHLGRSLGRTSQRPVLLLEIQAPLVQAARELARREQVEFRAQVCDVLQRQTLPSAPVGAQLVALHACGALHIEAIKWCLKEQLEALCVVPCCYHRQDAQAPRALSALAQEHDPQLSHAALRLATRNQGLSADRAWQQRQRRIQWRLAFDWIVRQSFGFEGFQRVGAYPHSWTKLDFPDFCRRLAAANFGPLTGWQDWDQALEWGRAAQVEREQWECVRRIFRRPIELWLALDRALLLTENNYEVELIEFCESAVSPRNLMIRARRAG